jgi:hypothetical protein
VVKSRNIDYFGRGDNRNCRRIHRYRRNLFIFVIKKVLCSPSRNGNSQSECTRLFDGQLDASAMDTEANEADLPDGLYSVVARKPWASRKSSPTIFSMFVNRLSPDRYLFRLELLC